MPGERCQAATSKGTQCRKTKDLTRTFLTIHREPAFVAKLPENVIVLLCPTHLRLSPVQKLVMRSIKPGKELPHA